MLNLFMVHPADTGAKVVLSNRLAELSKSFRVTFCCLAENDSDADGARALADVAEVVVARGAWRERSTLSRFAGLLRDPSATEFAPKLDAWFESDDLRRLLVDRRFDVVEVHSSCWHRRALANISGLRVLVAHNRELEYYRARARAAFRLSGVRAGLRASIDSLLVARQERKAIAASDAFVSLAPLPPDEQQSWFGDRPVLCNWGGVDLEHYRSVAEHPPRSTFETRGPRLTFIAAMFVESAIEGAARFAADALPRIREVHPRARLVLVGDHRDRPELLRLASVPGVEVTGWVPDVRPHLDEADVVIAPILGGSGVRYKIMEACAAAKPVLATRKAAEGLGLVHGQDALLCDTVAEMAPLALQALDGTELRTRLAQGALDAAHTRFDRVGEHDRLAAWYRTQLAATAAHAPSNTSPSK